MEIERQFLIKDIAVVPVDNATAKHEIQQGYLSFEPELRIRQMDDAYFLTFKSSGGLVRREEEISITASDFHNLLPREIPVLSSDTAVFDVYHNALNGLCMAEVEFPTVEAAQAFTLPAWFGREITYDARLTAANLVKHGWQWLKDRLGEKG